MSPVKRWNGSVTLSDPLTFPQVFAFQDALDAARSAGVDNGAKVNHALLPGIIACVEAWNLQRFPTTVTPETFPATPPGDSAKLVAWLVKELTGLFEDAETIPNA